MTIETIEKRLTANNIPYRRVNLIDGSAGIMASHDYTGLYPDKNTWETINTINKLFSKCSRVKMDHTRGYYQATLITIIKGGNT